MVKICTLIAFALFFAVTSLCQPHIFANNTFLIGFINHEVLALLAVILTVTLASVANIHLTMNRLISSRFYNNPVMISAGKEVKKELRENCWILFWGFFAAVVILVIKGSAPETDVSHSILNTLVLWILVLYILCMYDVYQVVFGIVNLDDGSNKEITNSDSSADDGDAN